VVHLQEVTERKRNEGRGKKKEGRNRRTRDLDPLPSGKTDVAIRTRAKKEEDKRKKERKKKRGSHSEGVFLLTLSENSAYPPEQQKEEGAKRKKKKGTGVAASERPTSDSHTFLIERSRQARGGEGRPEKKEKGVRSGGQGDVDALRDFNQSGGREKEKKKKKKEKGNTKERE